MSLITGTEPPHWHHKDDNGVYVHTLDDPRGPGVPKSTWTADQRLYAGHLNAHDAAIDPARIERLSTDHSIVDLLFDQLDATETKARRLREIIVAVRQAHMQGKTDEEITQMFRGDAVGSPQRTSERAQNTEVPH